MYPKTANLKRANGPKNLKNSKGDLAPVEWCQIDFVEIDFGYRKARSQFEYAWRAKDSAKL